MEVELPLPLTEAVVAKALAELSQGAATALESCLECYRSKRMSSADLLSFASSTSIHSASLAAVCRRCLTLNCPPLDEAISLRLGGRDDDVSWYLIQ